MTVSYRLSIRGKSSQHNIYLGADDRATCRVNSEKRKESLTVVQERVPRRRRQVDGLDPAPEFVVPLHVAAPAAGELVLGDVADVGLDAGEELDVVVPRDGCVPRRSVAVDVHLDLLDAPLAD